MGLFNMNKPVGFESPIPPRTVFDNNLYYTAKLFKTYIY